MLNNKYGKVDIHGRFLKSKSNTYKIHFLITALRTASHFLKRMLSLKLKIIKRLNLLLIGPRRQHSLQSQMLAREWSLRKQDSPIRGPLTGYYCARALFFSITHKQWWFIKWHTATHCQMCWPFLNSLALRQYFRFVYIFLINYTLQKCLYTYITVYN